MKFVPHCALCYAILGSPWPNAPTIPRRGPAQETSMIFIGDLTESASKSNAVAHSSQFYCSGLHLMRLAMMLLSDLSTRRICYADHSSGPKDWKKIRSVPPAGTAICTPSGTPLLAYQPFSEASRRLSNHGLWIYETNFGHRVLGIPAPFAPGVFTALRALGSLTEQWTVY